MSSLGIIETDHFSYTEIYVGTAKYWSAAEALPTPRDLVSALTLDNSVFVFGEFLISVNCMKLLREGLKK